MQNKTSQIIQPIIIGSGTSGQAIAKSLEFVRSGFSNIKLLPTIYAQRNITIGNYVCPDAKNILFIANPSGLHASTILAAEQSGYDALVCEKPICVTQEELKQLKNVSIPVNVLHGYRAMWGPRTIHQMIQAAELGEIFAIENRYWQSSAAQRSLQEGATNKSWKDDLQLNGPFDTLVDIGSHSIDMILYFMGMQPEKSYGWLAYANSSSAHRDTHAHLNLQFTNQCHAIVSLSKTYHGTTNNFEISVIGTKKAATWRFLNPDEVEIGEGNKILMLRRTQPNIATNSTPFHGLGWLEGYAEIVLQSLKSMTGLDASPIPSLSEALSVMECIFNLNLE